MDIQMPVMDGYEASRAIRALARPDAKTVPIVALTANAFKEDIEKAIAAGMNAHLAKPMEMEKLMEATFKLVKNR
jgi:CheY-like chemotaxis protein